MVVIVGRNHMVWAVLGDRLHVVTRVLDLILSY